MHSLQTFMQGFKEHFLEKRSENSFILVFRPVPLQNCRHKSSSCVSQKEICISHLKTPAFIDEALAKKGSALIWGEDKKSGEPVVKEWLGKLKIAVQLHISSITRSYRRIVAAECD